MAITHEERQSLWLQAVIDRRKLLDEVRVGQGYIRDRTVIFLTSGTVGLSLLLLSAVGENREHMILIFGSWVSCLGSLVAALLSFFVAQRVFGQELEYHDAITVGGEEAAKPPMGFLDHLTTLLNWLAVLGFAGGGICLILFAWFNLPH